MVFRTENFIYIYLIRKGTFFDVKLYSNALTMDSIGSCAFGIEIKSLENPDHSFVVNAKKILSVDGKFSLTMGFIAPQIAKLFNLNGFDAKALEYFGGVVSKISSHRRNKTNDMKDSKSDFIQMIIDANEEIIKGKFQINDSDFGEDKSLMGAERLAFIYKLVR